MYCVVSDGELAEGSIFEALRIAYEQKLTNLHVYFNCNGYAAYKDTDLHFWKSILNQFKGLNITMSLTNTDDVPSLRGLDAHYHTMTREEYDKVMEVLK